jgi:hypothetical protein
MRGGARIPDTRSACAAARGIDRRRWDIMHRIGAGTSCIGAGTGMMTDASWQRVNHDDPLAAPLFGIWFDGNQTGGNLGFPPFSYRHGDVPTGRIRVAAFDGSFLHCTTKISSGEGRLSSLLQRPVSLLT